MCIAEFDDTMAGFIYKGQVRSTALYIYTHSFTDMPEISVSLKRTVAEQVNPSLSDYFSK